MSAATDAVIPRILKTYETELLDEWLREQLSAFRAGSRISERDLRSQSTEFLNLLQDATQNGNGADVHNPAFSRVRAMLSGLVSC